MKGLSFDRFQNPLAFAALAGGAFFLFTQALLICIPLAAGESIVVLKAGDTIALMAGSITAAGLTAIYFQVLEAERAAETRAQEVQRQDALRLDAFHAQFGEVRRQRNLAYAYLAYLMSKPELMRNYARYWMLSYSFDVEVPSVDDLRKIFGEKGRPAGNTYDLFADLGFLEYDAAISAMTSFFVRLSIEVRRSLEPHGGLSLTTDVEIREALSPFFWNSYWREGLMALSSACDSVVNLEGQGKVEDAYFFKPLQDLDQLLFCGPAKVAGDT